MRIGLRILLGTFAIVALAAGLLSQVFVAQVKPGVRQTMEDTLVDMANVLAELATDDLLAGRIAEGRFAERVRGMQDRDPGAAIWGFPKRGTTYRIYVTDAQGLVVFDSTGRDVGKDYSQWNDVHLTLQGRYGARSTVSDPADPDSTVMHVAAPIRDGAGAIVGVLTVAKPNRTIAPFIERSQTIVMQWGIVLLGASLETMRTKLEGKQYVERYVQDLTHEMKSPLAAIRASAELLEGPLPEADRARFADAIRTQAERLALMIDRMLALAAVEHQQALASPESIELAALLESVEADSRPRLDARTQCLDVQVAGAPRVLGDAFLLRQAIDNLVENASDFAPSGSAIEVTARENAGQIEVRISDQGPGIPDYARDRVFERFYSLPRPEGGHRSSGLGLSFVAQVADLHGGSAALDNRPEGGAVATLRIPAVASA